MDSYQGFELGPIRPPSEASSLLLRLTRNCPWNRCSFCSVYKKDKFSLRPVEDILRDIDTMYRLVSELLEVGHEVRFRRGGSPDEEQAFYMATNWIEGGMESVFLQDADCMVMKPENLIRVLTHLRKRFPGVKRITTYGRSTSIARIGEGHLEEMAAAGLNRIHVGLETASDKILKMIDKGGSKKIHIEAGIKTRRAGIELSEYVLTGIGGREFSREHAIETADALSQIDPDFIRFRTLRISDRIQLFDSPEGHSWQRSPDLVLAKEILLLIENLENIGSCVKSDHMFNLFQEIDGTLPQDKDRLLGVLRAFIDMEPMDRARFQIGKRFGHFFRLSDMEIPGRLEQVEEICRRLEITAENVDDKINDLIRQRGAAL